MFKFFVVLFSSTPIMVLKGHSAGSSKSSAEANVLTSEGMLLSPGYGQLLTHASRVKLYR